VKGESERYRSGPTTHQGVLAGSIPGGASLLRCDEPRVTITAVKRAADGRALVVRLCNLDTAPVTATLTLGFAAAACRKAGLLEDELPVAREAPSLAAGGGEVRVPLVGGEIATVAIEPAP